MLGVPLKAMCSNMCASPVMPGTSCADPTLAWVAKVNTGATGRSQMMKVQPLDSLWTVTRFSKSDRLCAPAGRVARKAGRAAASTARPRRRDTAKGWFMVTSKKKLGILAPTSGIPAGFRSGPVAGQGQVDDLLDEGRVGSPRLLRGQGDLRLGMKPRVRVHLQDVNLAALVQTHIDPTVVPQLHRLKGRHGGLLT